VIERRDDNRHTRDAWHAHSRLARVRMIVITVLDELI
jgi:hypothetical protein